MLVHWRLYALSSCFKIRILRRCELLAGPLEVLTDCHLFSFRLSARQRKSPFCQIFSGNMTNCRGSSTIAKVIRRSLATGVRNFCIFARISNSWLPPTPVVVSHPYGSSVESHSTALSFVPLQCRDQIDTLFYSVLHWYSLSSCYLVAAFEVWISEIFWKINFDQTTGVNKNNLASSWLMFSRPLNLSKTLNSLNCTERSSIAYTQSDNVHDLPLD